MIRAIVQSVAEGVIKRFTAAGRRGEMFTSREYLQHYGFTSRPLAGAEAVVIRDGNHIVMIASDDRRYRIGMEAGEVALYTDEGDFVHLRRGRTIECATGTAIVTADVRCQVNSPEINLSGDRGGLRRLIDERFRTLFNNHVHSGVEPGSGTSGTPTAPLEYVSHATDIVRGA